MPNPILAQLMGSRTNAGINALSNMKAMLGNNPGAMFQQMMSGNPQFRQFVQQNQGKTPEQIASDYGVDFAQIKNLLK